jgi:hypothetical protein
VFAAPFGGKQFSCPLNAIGMGAGTSRHLLSRPSRVSCAGENHRQPGDYRRKQNSDAIVKVMRHDENVEQVHEDHKDDQKVREPSDFNEWRRAFLHVH